MAEKERLKGLLAKIESTYKTDSAPVVGTDGIQIEENIWSEIEIDYLEENLRDQMAQAGLGRSGVAAPDGQYGHITVTVALKGCDGAFSASKLPESDVLLRIAGLSRTDDFSVGTENVSYSPRSTGFESATIHAYSSGSIYELVGCRAQLTAFDLMPSQYGRMTFEIWGVVETITDATLPVITYAEKAIGPPNVKNAGLTLNSVDMADFSSFSIDMQTELAVMPRGNDADGHAGYDISDWNPQARITVDKHALATFNPYTLRSGGTRFAWDIGDIGTVQYNRIAISGPAGRIIGHPHSAEDGLAMHDLVVRLENTDEETPNDAFAILFD